MGSDAGVLIVAWAHACFGIYFWLRIKPIFAQLAPALTSVAVLLPVLALLGFYQGGRRVLALAHDPAFRAADLAPSQVGTAAQDAVLRPERGAAPGRNPAKSVSLSSWWLIFGSPCASRRRGFRSTPSSSSTASSMR